MRIIKIKDEINKLSNILIGCSNSTKKDFYFSGIDSKAMARKEVEIIFSYILKKDKVFLKIHDIITISNKDYEKIYALIKRRLKGEPLAYLIGTKEFFGYDFFVDSSTLIPRADTEVLVETALAYFLDKKETIYCSDFGTGTGCILLTLLKEWKNAYGIGLDISENALNLAKKNAKFLDVADRAFFLQSDFTCFDFMDNFSTFLNLSVKQKSLDLLISNPPYIPQNEYDCLDNSVKGYEPKTALYSPNALYKGTFHIEKLIQIAEKFLKPKGLLLIEHGYNQGNAVYNICSSYAFEKIETKYDYAGNERFLFAIKQ